jgi:hypothetical protein
MTDVIKPFTVFGVQNYPDGKMIAYEVSRRYLDDDGIQHTEKLRATTFAPLDADVDEFMLNYLKESQWLI